MGIYKRKISRKKKEIIHIFKQDPSQKERKQANNQKSKIQEKRKKKTGFRSGQKERKLATDHENK